MNKYKFKVKLSVILKNNPVQSAFSFLSLLLPSHTSSLVNDDLFTMTSSSSALLDLGRLSLIACILSSYLLSYLLSFRTHRRKNVVGSCAAKLWQASNEWCQLCNSLFSYDFLERNVTEKNLIKGNLLHPFSTLWGRVWGITKVTGEMQPALQRTGYLFGNSLMHQLNSVNSVCACVCVCSHACLGESAWLPQMCVCESVCML